MRRTSALPDDDRLSKDVDLAGLNCYVEDMRVPEQVTGSLNPALSNSAWEAKRPELLKYGKLNLMQYFHSPDVDTWGEDKIEARSQHLFEHLKQIWHSIR